MKVWRLMAFGVSDRLGGLLTRLGFRPTKKNPANWWRLFDPSRPGDRDLAKQVLADLKSAGIGSSWSEVDKSVQPQPRRRQGKARHRRQPDSQILSIEIAAENRQARDALKVATEKRRQAEKLAEREAAAAARAAVSRARGGR